MGPYEAAVKVRRLGWQQREVPLEPDRWPLLADRRPSPHQDAEMHDLLAGLQDAIERDLTPHQREVVIALALNEVPIDVLAEQLNTTRGALYKRSTTAAASFAQHSPHAASASTHQQSMNSNHRHYELLVARLTGPIAPGLSCEACFDELDRYVELQLAGTDADAAIPGMREHLQACPACAEDHLSLHALIADNDATTR